MKQRQIVITENFEWQFSRQFGRLGDAQQRIYKYIDRFCKRYPNVFPLQSTIAKECKCSRKHVNRTMRLFKEFGWIVLVSRGQKRAKVIVLAENNLLMDLNNIQYFRRIEVTCAGAHTLPQKKKITSRKTGGASPPIEVPFYLQKLNISLDSKLKLSLVSEHTYQETYHTLQRRAEKGFIPKDPEAYFIGTALKMAQKKGEKIPWKRYYATVAT